MTRWLQIALPAVRALLQSIPGASLPYRAAAAWGWSEAARLKAQRRIVEQNVIEAESLAASYRRELAGIDEAIRLNEQSATRAELNAKALTA